MAKAGKCYWCNGGVEGGSNCCRKCFQLPFDYPRFGPVKYEVMKAVSEVLNAKEEIGSVRNANSVKEGAVSVLSVPEVKVSVPTCEVCGKGFEAERRTAKYCSDSCRKAAFFARKSK